MKYCPLFIFTVLVMGVSLTAFSQSVIEERLETYLNRLHHNQGFNGEILVARGNHIIFQKAIGMASFEHDVPLMPGAKYRIASNSKSFTATLLAMAQTDGQLSLDDKASLYLDLLSPKFGAITIEQLIQHTSGLPHNEAIDDYWLTKSKLHLTTEQVINEINSLELLFPPRTQMRYSSLGYYLLACILEEVYQQPFKNILQDKILSKLQMNHTGFVDGLEIIPQMTTGYHWVTDARLVVAPYRNYSMLKGAGDMYATTTDLLKWNNSFLNQTLLSTWPQNINAHSTESTTTSGVAYSFGWYVDISGPIKYYHGGGTWGYTTYNSFYGDTDQTSIIILSNASRLPITEIGLDIEKMVFDKAFKMPSLNKISDQQLELDTYSGKFVMEHTDRVLQIIKRDNKLYAQLEGNPPFEIYPKTEHVFFGKKVALEIYFEVEQNKFVSGLRVERKGQTIRFNKHAE